MPDNRRLMRLRWPARGRLAGWLPAARLTVCGGERHFFFRRRLAEILGSLMVCA